MCLQYEEALRIPKHVSEIYSEDKGEGQHKDPDPTQENPCLGLFTGPKMFLTVKICPNLICF